MNAQACREAMMLSSRHTTYVTTLLLTACLTFVFSASAKASAIYTEIGDAGDTVATAQQITDPDTRTIIGTRANADVFGFNWPTEGNFTIDALIPSSDPPRVLALLDPTGTFLFGSSALVGMIVSNLHAGDYYLYVWGGPEN
jgi:hypothetical protein